MKSLRGKPRSIMFLGFNSLLSQQAAGNYPGEIKKFTQCDQQWFKSGAFTFEEHLSMNKVL